MQFLQFGDDSHDQVELHRKISEIHLRRRPCRFMAHLNQQLPPPDEDSPSPSLPPLAKTASTNLPLFTRSLSPSGPQQAQLPKKANTRKRITIQKKVSEHLPLNGAGVIKLKDGKVVFGTWKEGQPEGSVKIMYPSGSLYIGEVKNYIRSGKGLFCYRNGYQYQGDFVNGKFEGYGVVKNELGEVVNKGVWSNGLLVQSII